MNASIVAGGEVSAQVNYVSDPPSSVPGRWAQYYAVQVEKSTLALEGHEVVIRDASPVRGDFSLEVQGFQLVDHISKALPLDTPERLEIYQREMEQLVRDMSGATDVKAIGPTLRLGEPANPSQQNRPARMVHADAEDESIHWLFERCGMDTRDYRRFASFNIWRPLTPPPEDIPLALCDARTLAPDDRVTVISVYDAPGVPISRNLVSVYRPNPAHRWYYFRDITPDNALIFKTHDSDPAFAPRVAHSAFQDASCPLGVPTRQSAEIRMMLGFR